jgi:hypothetical protein
VALWSAIRDEPCGLFAARWHSRLAAAHQKGLNPYLAREFAYSLASAAPLTSKFNKRCRAKTRLAFRPVKQ